MRLDGQKDLATIGDTVIDFLIMEHFLKENYHLPARVQNILREKHGKNRTLHEIAKTPQVHLNGYIIKTKNERCAETGKTCLAVFFEALVAKIYIEHGLDETREFFQRISFFENVKKFEFFIRHPLHIFHCSDLTGPSDFPLPHDMRRYLGSSNWTGHHLNCGCGLRLFPLVCHLPCSCEWRWHCWRISKSVEIVSHFGKHFFYFVQTLPAFFCWIRKNFTANSPSGAIE